jgi:HlyD family secretion protein
VKKPVLGGIPIGAVAIAAMVLARVSAKQPGDDLHRAETARVSRRDVGSVVKATGVIKPMVGAEVRVGSSASGVVARLFVRIGDRVQKGQLLAELDSRELVARRASSEAALRLSQANMSYARADLQRKREAHALSERLPNALH